MLERLHEEDDVVATMLHFETCRDDVGVDALAGEVGSVNHLIATSQRAVERIQHFDADVIGDSVRRDLGRLDSTAEV